MILGLATNYPGDSGITDHPQVHFSANFETSDWGDGWSYGTGASTLTRVLLDASLEFEPLLGYALRVEIPQGTNTGMSVGYEFADKLGYEPEEIWMNVYHGGTTPVGQDVHLYIDNVVIADEYSGPMFTGLFADGFESGNTSAWSSATRVGEGLCALPRAG